MDGPANPALTSRQREVLLLICEGLSANEIGAKLGISPKTVEFHTAHVHQRAGVRNAALLVRWAIRNGLLEA